MSNDAIDTNHVPTDDWTLPKLAALAATLLAVFFVFIYFVSP